MIRGVSLFVESTYYNLEHSRYFEIKFTDPTKIRNRNIVHVISIMLRHVLQIIMTGQ